MNDDPISDDPGTVLDSYVSFPHLPPAAVRPPAHRAPPPQEVLYKSVYRWTAPRILICNDGSLDEGETVHIRSDKIVIGRSKGDIVIGHDVAMSGSHAEIARRDCGGKHAWQLRDLGSSNGTLVRVSSVTLHPGTSLQLGSKRFRFELPEAAQPGGSDPGTLLLSDVTSAHPAILPALIESTPGSDGKPLRHLFRSTRVTIGRPGCGNDIELDDLCLAATHAVVTRDPNGAWELESSPSLNRVWVRVDAIKLTDNCLFQCGEQRFRFWL